MLCYAICIVYIYIFFNTFGLEYFFKSPIHLTTFSPHFKEVLYRHQKIYFNKKQSQGLSDEDRSQADQITAYSPGYTASCVKTSDRVNSCRDLLQYPRLPSVC